MWTDGRRLWPTDYSPRGRVPMCCLLSHSDLGGRPAALASLSIQVRSTAEEDSATAEHLGSRGSEERDEAPRGWSQAATLRPYRPHVPTRLGVAQGDFDERWVVMWRARQHGDAQAGPHKSAQCFVLFALEGKVWDESRSLAQ